MKILFIITFSDSLLQMIRCVFVCTGVLISLIPFSSFKSLNIVECREFRALLLLLHSDLKETMVPHCTKLQELIIKAWKQHFQALKQDLGVISS
jgi:hypothetical protein